MSSEQLEAERKAFERAITGPSDGAYRSVKNEDGSYSSAITERLWKVWQAARSHNNSFNADEFWNRISQCFASQDVDTISVCWEAALSQHTASKLCLDPEIHTDFISVYDEMVRRGEELVLIKSTPYAPRVVSYTDAGMMSDVFRDVFESTGDGVKAMRAALESIAPTQQEPAGYITKSADDRGMRVAYNSRNECNNNAGECVPYWLAPQPAQPSMTVAVARVIGGHEHGDFGIESRVVWLFNPMPEGSELYEVTAPAHPSVPDDWKPTTENINELPDPIRNYIASLETNADPAGTIRENVLVREENAMLRALVKEQEQPSVPVEALKSLKTINFHDDEFIDCDELKQLIAAHDGKGNDRV